MAALQEDKLVLREEADGSISAIRRFHTMVLGSKEVVLEEMRRFMTAAEPPDVGIPDWNPASESEAEKPIIEIDEANFLIDPDLDPGR
jgi:hypothetical protein